MNLSTKQKQIHRHREQTCICQGEGDGGGMEWEVGISRRKLLHLLTNTEEDIYTLAPVPIV